MSPKHRWRPRLRQGTHQEEDHLADVVQGLGHRLLELLQGTGDVVMVNPLSMEIRWEFICLSVVNVKYLKYGKSKKKNAFKNGKINEIESFNS